MADLSVEHLTRVFSADPFAGVRDVSLHVEANRSLTVVGPSGSGKSTLLRLVAGLDSPDSGVVRIDGRDVTRLPPRDRDVALVPQRPALYPHLSVRENLAIGAKLRRPRILRAEIGRRVDECIAWLGLETVLDRRPHQLSGGEQQRVALGRVVVRRPAVWLLDEPFSHLDAVRKVQFRRDMLLLMGRSPATILFVTHDPDEASCLGHHLAVLRQGSVIQTGPPADLFARPADRHVAELIGTPAMNLVDGALSREGGNLLFATTDGCVRLAVPAELATRASVGRPVTLGIRPDDLQIAPPTSLPPQVARVSGWTVRAVERLFPRALVTADLGKWAWSFWWGGDELPTIGDQLELEFSLAKAHWFES